MADTFTEFLNLTRPEVGGSRDAWGTKLNANMALIDAWAKSTDVLAKGSLQAIGKKNLAGEFVRQEVIGTVRFRNSLETIGSGGLLVLNADGTSAWRIRSDVLDNLYFYFNDVLQVVFYPDGTIWSVAFNGSVKEYIDATVKSLRIGGAITFAPLQSNDSLEPGSLGAFVTGIRLNNAGQPNGFRVRQLQAVLGNGSIVNPGGVE